MDAVCMPLQKYWIYKNLNLIIKKFRLKKSQKKIDGGKKA